MFRSSLLQSVLITGTKTTTKNENGNQIGSVHEKSFQKSSNARSGVFLETSGFHLCPAQFVDGQN